jgi:uncharacterized protein GlcG (DUF336 family)
MKTLTLSAANCIVDKALEKGKELKFHPLTVVVLDAGGHIKVAKRDDGCSLLRIEIALGKAWGTLGMGFGGREIARRAVKQAGFYAVLSDMSGGRMVPVPGGVLIKSETGDVIGAVGISGDTSDNDETCAVYGIKAAGLIPDTGDPAA